MADPLPYGIGMDNYLLHLLFCQCTEIERMQRQLVEQQKTERKISRQLEDNCLRLQHSNYRTKQHATAIKSGRGNNIPIPPPQLSRNVVLPKINQEYPKKATRKRFNPILNNEGWGTSHFSQIQMSF